MTYKKEKKVDLTLLQKPFLVRTARVLEHGAGKHGRDNYLTNPAVEDGELIAAIGRHWAEALQNPEAVDPDHGETHVAAIAANCNMLLARFEARQSGAWYSVKSAADAPVGSKVRNTIQFYGRQVWPEGTEFEVVDASTLSHLSVRRPGTDSNDRWLASLFEVWR